MVTFFGYGFSDIPFHFYLFLSVIILSFILFYMDYHKKRNITRNPFISFIMPTYNDAKYIGDSIKSIFDCYDKKNFELIVVNDRSPDNTLSILKELSQKYKFKVITNKTNMGKSKSVNMASKQAKGELIFILDSDTLLNKKALNEVISRFEHNPKLGVASCPYTVRNKKNFLTIMQDLEYNYLSFTQATQNSFSTVAAWGGCIAFRKNAFLQIGGFSLNFITEDIESTLKLSKLGWMAEQANAKVATIAPEKLRGWFKQKIRWCSGFFQCFLKYPEVYIKHPIFLFLNLSYIVLGVGFLFNFIPKIISIYYVFAYLDELHQTTLSFVVGAWHVFFPSFITILKKVVYALVYPLISLGYVLMDEEYREKPSMLLWVIPYSFVYLPVYFVITIYGFIIGIGKYLDLKKNENSVAWGGDEASS